jgi:hypothetical protein
MWLPLIQVMVGLSLWLYMPVQFRKEILELQHRPTEHPFRYEISSLAPEEKNYLYPPLSGRALYVVNLPADFVRRRIIDPIIAHRADLMQNGGPTWDFALPIEDPKALEPKKILYSIKEGDIAFFLGVILVWYWAGSRIDEYSRAGGGIHRHRRKASRITELVLVGMTCLLLLADCITLIEYSPILYDKVLPSNRLIGECGLIWPVALLIYLWLGIKRELRSH